MTQGKDSRTYDMASRTQRLSEARNEVSCWGITPHGVVAMIPDR